MKKLLLLPLVIAACQTPEPIIETPVIVADTTGNTIAQNQISKIRTSEQLKAYRINPYQDPNNPNIRHDAHMITRIEQSAAWNLRPYNVAPIIETGPNTELYPPAHQPIPVNGEMEETLTKQKLYTAAILEAAKVQDQQMKVLQESVQQLTLIKAENQTLKQTVQTLNNTLTELKEAETQRKKKEEEEAKKAALPFYKKWIN